MEQYKWIIICFNIPSVLLFFFSQWNRAKWLHSNNEGHNTSGAFCFDFYFLAQVLILMISPWPNGEEVYQHTVQDLSGIIETG